MFKRGKRKDTPRVSKEFEEMLDSIEEEKKLVDMYSPGDRQEVRDIIETEDGEIDTDMLFMTGAEIAEKYSEEINTGAAVDLVIREDKEGVELGEVGTYVVATIMVVGFIYFILRITAVIR